MPDAWSKVAFLPVWKTIKHMALHPALRHLSETQVQERVLHACLGKVLAGSEEYCGTGVLSRDCNLVECWVVLRLMLWICDLKEQRLLTSSPNQVRVPGCPAVLLPACASWAALSAKSNPGSCC